MVDARRPLQLLVGAVAAHSLALGVCMLLVPKWTLGLVGWDLQGPAFFPAQSGLFLMLLGAAYARGVRERSFAWFLVASKGSAVVFLVGAVLLDSAPGIVLLTALLDGLMGAAVLAALLRAR